MHPTNFLVWCVVVVVVVCHFESIWQTHLWFAIANPSESCVQFKPYQEWPARRLPWIMRNASFPWTMLSFSSIKGEQNQGVWECVESKSSRRKSACDQYIPTYIYSCLFVPSVRRSRHSVPCLWLCHRGSKRALAPTKRTDSNTDTGIVRDRVGVMRTRTQAREHRVFKMLVKLNAHRRTIRWPGDALLPRPSQVCKKLSDIFLCSDNTWTKKTYDDVAALLEVAVLPDIMGKPLMLLLTLTCTAEAEYKPGRKQSRFPVSRQRLRNPQRAAAVQMYDVQWP